MKPIASFFTGLLLTVLTSTVFTQETLLPLNTVNKDELILNSSDDSVAFVGTGLFPVAENQVFSTAYKEQERSNRRYWFGRKLFDEHFVELRGDDYFLSIDPLAHLSLGREQGLNETNLFQNTRAFQVSGEVMDNFSFYTAFFENQARFASFQNDYFISRGELYLTGNGYNPQNAVIPGGGRTKPFKEDAFDYAASVSHIRYRPSKHVAIQLGNTPNFVGWGHRSMLLSDNSFYATTIRIDATITERLHFSRLNSKHLNLRRRVQEGLVEAPYERKNYTANYISYQVTDDFTLGVFEATVFQRDDSLESQWINPMYFNPIPLINTAVFGWESEAAKSLIGLNMSYKIGKNNLVFGQLVTDQLGSTTEFGYQIGWRTNGILGIKNLYTHLEFNSASSGLYAANNRRINYTHFNLPLAHTLGNGFREFIMRAGYNFKRIYFEGHAVTYRSNQRISNLGSLFDNKGVVQPEDQVQVLFAQLETGYCFNPRTRLSVFAQATVRTSTSELHGDHNALMFVLGVKTRIFNHYMDF